MLQDVWFLEKLAHFDREVIPERRMHAKGSGAYGSFTVTHDITQYTRAKIFSAVGKQTDLFVRFSIVAGERGAADAERDIRGFAVKFYTEEGNWDLVGNLIPVNAPRCPAHSYHRDGAMRVDGNFGGTLGYEPNSEGEWKEQPDFAEPPLRLEGAADHWNHREDTDYYSQPGALFRLMTPAQQQALFDNTAHSLGEAPHEIQIRHISNCLMAEPAYGKGVADALGIALGDLSAQAAF